MNDHTTISARGLALFTLLGLVVGFATQRAADISPSVGYAVSTFTGPWVVVGALVARRVDSVRLAAVGATAYLLAATVAYYATFLLVKTHAPLLLLAGWIVVSLIVGPMIGWLGYLTGHGGAHSGAASGALAGWLLGEAFFAAMFMSNPNRWTLVVLNVIAAGGLLLAGRGSRARAFATASVLLLPSASMIGFRFLVGGALL